MSYKDPEDTTVSEMLRVCARTSNRPDLVAAERYVAEACVDDYVCDLQRLFRAIADKIDAELAQAKVEAAYTTDKPLSEVVAHYTGLYAKDAEPISEWLDRWFLPRPSFDDGEPVQFGDDTDKLSGVEKFIFLRSGGGCCQMQDAEGNIHNAYPSNRVKRPAPEVLGTDGKPIKVDETVYPTYGSYIGEPCKVLAVLGQDNVRVSVPGGGNERFYGCYLTHTPPDTQERIDVDALKSSYGYWGCTGYSCEECPSMIDGKKPFERYQCGECCLDAMKLDLLRRQRELDQRMGGAE